LKIETNHQLINTTQETAFDFLSNMNNFEKLLPKDKIENWSATNETCTFKIKSMGNIELKQVATTPNSLIYLDSYGKTPIKFSLNLYLSEKTDSSCEAYALFDGDINPFMKMMLEKPLTEFFNYLVTRLSKIYQK
jgi:hypothetical protein